jgi:hypothetical protein
MLKQAATIDDRFQDRAAEMDVDRGISVEPENHDEFDFENRWTPVAFTLALGKTNSEI